MGEGEREREMGEREREMGEKEREMGEILGRKRGRERWERW